MNITRNIGTKDETVPSSLGLLVFEIMLKFINNKNDSYQINEPPFN